MKLSKFYKTKLKDVLKENKEESALFIYLSYILKLSPTDFYLNQDMELSDSDIERFNLGFDEYLYKNKPIQHLTNEMDFFGYKFYVDNRVLIPRFETEELVENVLMYYDEYFSGDEVDACDIGTGSGAIAISLALEEKNMKVIATDISNDALDVAKMNNEKLGANVSFRQGDMVEPLKGNKFDIIVSNPPYLPDDDEVDPLVKDNEPSVALFGKDGLYFYDIILKNAKDIMKDRCLIAFEHGYNTAEKIKALALKYYPNAKVIQKKDMQGLDRMTFVFVGDFND